MISVKFVFVPIVLNVMGNILCDDTSSNDAAFS